jgi:tetratricopeptide (TPR) repeat protein
MESPSLQAELNPAISQYRQQRYRDARSTLQALLSRDPGNVTAWNVLAYLEGDIGDAAAAAAAFDRALELRPDDSTALKGRARVALERAETNVLHRYADALVAAPGDPHLILETTEARIAAGDIEAIDEFAEVAGQRPEWSEGQIALGRMLWETRQEEGFADHVRLLLRRDPTRFDLWWQYVDLLAGCGLYESAADAARAAAGGGDAFRLVEAVHAGRAGDVARAGALFASIPPRLPGRALHESVHHIRRQELDLALACIEAALAENPSDIGAWAVAELIYRKLGDRRSTWLSAQGGLVATFELALAPERFAAIKALLHLLHRTGVQMVEQSLRSGTQTRWRLFDRPEPELAELRRAIEAALGDYVAALPPADDRHPLLRHRDAPLTITGSWSVRLAASGYHVSHIHPKGLISSACYFEVPGPVAPSGEGALELGRPPSDLKLDLEPLHVIAPCPGRLVLFPSYLHHGTTPFAAGDRLSVAFDVHRHPLG